MTLKHIPLTDLTPAKANVRKKGAKDVADLVPSIRALGLIQPLLVRATENGFEIIAGQRRYHALVALAAEQEKEPDAIPCLVMDDGDDAKAIEASLAENVARLPMDEIDQYKAFAALIKKGMSASDIAAHFGISERLVGQRLAIANLIAPLLTAYRREEIGADTLRTLTMATQSQQRDWLTLFQDETSYAPTGRALKDWLFGGQHIPIKHALFDPDTYEGTIIADLFGDDRYFADAGAFWIAQNTAIAALRERYLGEGWAEVVLLDVGSYFARWEHRQVKKKDGGKVFIAIAHNGEVTAYEGYLSEKEARKREKANEIDGAHDSPASQQPETTKAMQNYLALHRHAALRAELLARPGIALRLAVAHMIAGSPLWRVETEPQRADKPEIAKSVAASKAQAAFETERTALAGLLGIEADDENRTSPGLETVFAALLEKDDETVQRVLTIAMAATLSAQTGLVDALGAHLAVDMRRWWTPDDTFLDLCRNKAALNDMVREIAGTAVANANVSSTLIAQRAIIRDCLSGKRKAQTENWLPKYMTFPAGADNEAESESVTALEDEAA